jgi:hypothetical protein
MRAMAVWTWVLLQLLVSAKAGLVNYVDGSATVQVHEQVSVGKPIQTGSGGHVEVLLNPGSFLRLATNSTAILDSDDLADIALRITAGSALIDAASVDKHAPIHVTAGNLRALIVSPGLYRFSINEASVFDGKIEIADSSLSAKKGQRLTWVAGQYDETQLTSTVEDDLDVWSRQRSALLAQANALVYNGGSSGSYIPFGAGSVLGGVPWLYSPFLDGFTFIPRRPYRSFYGDRFFPISIFLGQTSSTSHFIASHGSSHSSKGHKGSRSSSSRGGHSGGAHGGSHGGHR